MQGKKVLVIEDELFTRKAIEETFRRAGAEVCCAADGLEGLSNFYSFQPDLVTLDIMMPHTDGWETCRQIRQVADTPIIMLTGVKDEDSVVRALDMGAVDFVIKPFSPNILLARARSALRQIEIYSPEQVSHYSDDYLTINIEKRNVTINGASVKLTKTEFNLLAYLVYNRGLILTFDQILSTVWGVGYEDSVEYIHVYISRLRRKLEVDAKNPIYLLSEHGVGYRFEGLL